MLNFKQRRLFVFDLDDTLMWNAHMYGVAMQKFYSFLLEIWDKRVPALGSVAAFSEEIDAKLGKEINPQTGEPFGFSMERFPTSLVKTYEHLCEIGFGEYDTETADLVYLIGLTVFDKKNYWEVGLVPGASETLNFIRDEGDDLALVTKGDKRVQEQKVDALGLEQWFESVHIVDGKTPGLFAEIESTFSPRFSYSVGNSFFSDIQPALDAGYAGIYIPCYTWKVEKLPDEYDSAKVITTPKITEIIELYKENLI